MARQAVLELLADASRLKSTLKDAGDDTESFGKKVGSHVEGIGNAIVGMAKTAAIVGIPAVIGFGVAAVKAFSESEAIGKQTEAVLKSTGGAAGVSADHVGDLAGKLSMLSGVDDEVIQSGENVLLTFTNIKNGVGKNNQIFDQATGLALDMSVALGTDLSAANIQVGKALNDPVKGITALSKAGVSFTQQQKDQIKTLVASGDTLGAQKIIVKELSTEFGGSAKAAGETFAGALNRLKVIVGNFMEDVGAKLVPVITHFAQIMADNVPAALAAATPWIDRIKDALNTLGAVLQDNVLPAVSKVWSFIQGNLTPVLAGLAVVAGVILYGAVLALGTAIAALMSPVVLIVGGLAVLVGSVVYAYQNFEAFRTVVDTVASFLRDTVLPIVVGFAQGIIGQFSNVVSWVQQFWPQISEAIGHVMAAIETVIRTVVGVITILWHQWGDDLLRAVQTIWNFIRETIDNAIQLVRGIIQTVVALINGDWGRAWDGIKNIVGAIWDQIGNVISTAIGLIKSTLAGWASTVGETFAAMVEGIVKAILSIPGRVANVGKDILSKMIPDIPGAGIISGVISHIPGFAAGGVVPGPVGMPQLAVVHGGETVIPTGGRAGGGGGMIVHVHVNGFVGPGGERALGNAVREALRQDQRVSGRLGF